MDPNSLLRFLIGILFLSIASYQDIKKREVNTIIFLLMGLLGVFLMFLEFRLDIGIFIALIIFIISFFNIKKMDHILNLFLLIILILYLYYGGNKIIFVDSILLLIFKYLYYSGLLMGGADTKAMMAITLLIPYYPVTFTGLDIRTQIVSIIFPYPIEVLFYSVILNALIYMPYLYHFNKKNGFIKMPEMLTKIFKNGKWVKYETPFIFSITLSFIISYIFSLFYIF